MTLYALSIGHGISGIKIMRIFGPETKKIVKLLINKDIVCAAL
tara:strand:- start:896 stop:1024 length:129 start_codon:yes stop_codon:yes gene_type:complete